MSVAAAATPAPLPLTRAYRGVPLGERVLFSKHSVYKVLSWPFWLSSFRFLAESQKGLCLTVVLRWSYGEPISCPLGRAARRRH